LELLNLYLRMPRHTYLRPANDDYAPDENIKLGYVWRDPRDPGTFIGEPVAIPETIKVNHNFKGAWVKDMGKKTSGSFALLAKLFSLPIGGSLNASYEDVKDGKYTIPSMDTYSFEPTEDYVLASIEAVSQDILRTGASLYMVTGTKIARGGQGSRKESRKVGFEESARIDGSSVGAPVEAGEKAGLFRESHDNEEFGSTGDFVFAYRIRKIIYRKGILKTEEYNKGAVMGEETMGGAEEARLEVTAAEVDDEDVVSDGDVISCADDDGEEWDIIV